MCCYCCSPLKIPLVREMLAEFLGAFIVTLVGDSVTANILFSGAGAGGGLASGPMAWGIGVAIGILIAGGVSGGHVNPAVTVGMATVGKLPLIKVIPYIFSQVLGGFLAAAVIFVVYHDAMDNFDKGVRMIDGPTGTAAIFSCFPLPGVTWITCLFDQMVSAMLLLIAISAITDDENLNVPAYLHPLYVGLAVAATMYAFTYNLGNPLNPARDFGPRVFMAMAGWGSQVFSYRDFNWFWVPVVGPIAGGVIGVWLYKIFVSNYWPDSNPVLLTITSTTPTGAITESTDKTHF